MGRKSSQENPNIYLKSRENEGLTREAAVEQLVIINADRLYRIEHDETLPHPEEVLRMMDVYKNAMLRNYYCTHECEIGKRYIRHQDPKSLSQITVEMLNTLYYLEDEKKHFTQIVADGIISEEEFLEFENIKEKFSEMANVIDSLKLWVEQTKLDDRFPEKDKVR